MLLKITATTRRNHIFTLDSADDNDHQASIPETDGAKKSKRQARYNWQLILHYLFTQIPIFSNNKNVCTVPHWQCPHIPWNYIINAGLCGITSRLCRSEKSTCTTTISTYWRDMWQKYWKEHHGKILPTNTCCSQSEWRQRRSFVTYWRRYPTTWQRRAAGPSMDALQSTLSYSSRKHRFVRLTAVLVTLQIICLFR